jgi:F0F1-type ATP synthase membrane subunit c/vacuolar-type H+-ATPase subunit K
MPQNYHRHYRVSHRRAITLIGIGLGLGVGFAALPAIGQGVSWGDLIKWLAPQRRSGATRDGSLCILSMDQQPPIINPSASRTPTLVWQGTAQKIGLRRSGEDRDFWQRELKFKLSGIQHMRYAGTLLEPGASYTWVIYGLHGQTKADFTILSADDQTALTTELATQTDLTARLSIYEAKQLRSDAWSEIIKPRNQTPELKQAITAAPDQICPKSSPASTGAQRP